MPNKKIPLLEAYQKAFNNPLRVSKRQLKQLQDAMSQITRIGDSTFDDRFTQGGKGNSPHWSGPVKQAGEGTKDQMPGTSPNATDPRKLGNSKKKKSTYISTPLDTKYGKKGYI